MAASISAIVPAYVPGASSPASAALPTESSETFTLDSTWSRAAYSAVRRLSCASARTATALASARSSSVACATSANSASAAPIAASTSAWYDPNRCSAAFTSSIARSCMLNSSRAARSRAARTSASASACFAAASACAASTFDGTFRLSEQSAGSIGSSVRSTAVGSPLGPHMSPPPAPARARKT